MSILAEAATVIRARSAAYGHPREDFRRTATLWSAILNAPVTPQQVALCLIAVKLSRECFRHQRDNLVDIAGYAETVAMLGPP